jgi:hypothetical protein
MKYIQRAIAISGLFLILATSAFAQTDGQTVIDIPFNFNVGQKTLPAGKYIIQPNKRDSMSVWVVKNRETNESALIITNNVDANEVPQATKVVFNRYDDLYFLSQFWTAGSIRGREIPVSKQERGLEKTLAAKKQEHVLIGRAR